MSEIRQYGQGSMWEGWGEKMPEPVRRRKRTFFEKHWKNIVRIPVYSGLIGLTTLFGIANHRQNERLAAEQKARIEFNDFLSSEEFQRFADDFGAKSYLTLKYIGDNPQEAAENFPTKEEILPWTFHAPKLSDGYNSKDLVSQVGSNLSRYIAKEGFSFSERERNLGINKILQLLPPHLIDYSRNHPTSFVKYISNNPAMLRDITTKMAENRGGQTSADDIERLGVICNYLADNAMKYAEESDRKKSSLQSLNLISSYNPIK